MSIPSTTEFADTSNAPAGLRAAGAAPIAHVEVYGDFAEAEALWRAFEPEAVATPYHRFDWMEPWFRHIGMRADVSPVIAVGRAADGTVTALWPLGARRIGPGLVASWLGGKHVNYHMGLYRRDAAGLMDADALEPMLWALRRKAGVHVLQFVNQPEGWQGMRNPLAALPHQASPSFAYSLALQPDFETLYQTLRSGSTRKKLRRAERQMIEARGSCEMRRPETPEEADRLLDAFFTQKTERMREKNLANVFAEPGIMDFVREIGHRSLGAREPLLDMFWLDAGGKVVATWAGTTFNGRLCGMFNSFAIGEFDQFHPGELVLRHLIEDACRRGLAEFDLGVGEAGYKDAWCPRTDRLFDSFLPLSAAGRAYVQTASAVYRLKRRVKQSPAVMSLLQKLRY